MSLTNCTVKSVFLKGAYSLVASHSHSDVFVTLGLGVSKGSINFNWASPLLIIAAALVSFQYFSSNHFKFVLEGFLLLALEVLLSLNSLQANSFEAKQ